MDDNEQDLRKLTHEYAQAALTGILANSREYIPPVEAAEHALWYANKLIELTNQ